MISNVMEEIGVLRESVRDHAGNAVNESFQIR
jgi:hypothetical protein